MLRPALSNRPLGLLDQLLSSSQNVVVALLTARMVSAEEFGGFSIATIVYMLVVGLSQAGLGEIALLTSHTLPERQQDRRLGAYLVAGILLGTLAGVLVALVSLLLPGQVKGPLLVLALSLPLMVGHDCARFAFIARDRPRDALRADCAWVLVWIAALITIRPTGAVSALAVWGLTCAAGVAYSLWILRRILPSSSDVRDVLTGHRHLRSRLVGEYLSVSAGAQITILGFSAVAGLTMGGGVRGAQILLGPLNTLYNALRMLYTPDAARNYAATGRIGLRLPIRLGGGMAALTAVAGAVLLFLPVGVGEELLGKSWTITQDVLPFIIVQRVLGLSVVGPLATLRAGGRAGTVMLYRGSAEIIGGVLCILATVTLGPMWGVAFMISTAAMDSTAMWTLLIRGWRHDAATVPLRTGDPVGGQIGYPPVVQRE
jgi:O-antigen/teichoic acid export membrane protein